MGGDAHGPDRGNPALILGVLSLAGLAYAVLRPKPSESIAGLETRLAGVSEAG
jgi:hypothetical protein